jgi:hypothetical protein
VAGTASCATCANGKFLTARASEASNDSADDCTACVAGQCMAGTGAACTACAAGQSTGATIGLTECIDCIAGTWAAAN